MTEYDGQEAATTGLSSLQDLLAEAYHLTGPMEMEIRQASVGSPH